MSDETDTIIIAVNLEGKDYKLGYRIERDKTELRLRKAFQILMSTAWNTLVEKLPIKDQNEARYSPVFWDLRNDERAPDIVVENMA